MQDIETYDTVRRATQRIEAGRARIPPSRPSQLLHESTLVIKGPSGNGQVNEEGPHSRPSRPATESTLSPSASETNEAITIRNGNGSGLGRVFSYPDPTRGSRPVARTRSVY